MKFYNIISCALAIFTLLLFSFIAQGQAANSIFTKDSADKYLGPNPKANVWSKFWDESPEQSLQTAYACLRYASEERDSSLIGKSHYHLGLLNFYSYNDSLAQLHFLKSIDILNELDEPNYTMMAHYNYGRLIRFFSEYEQALVFIEKSLDLAKVVKDTLHQIDANFQLGNVYEFQNKIKKSFEHYIKALKISESRNDTIGQFMVQMRFARVHIMESHYEIAFDKLQKCRTLLPGLISRDSADLMNSFGIFYSSHNELDSAEYYFNKSLSIATRLGGENTLEAQLITHLAIVFLKKKEYEKSLEYFELYQTKNMEHYLSVDQFNVNSNYGVLLNVLGRTDESIELCRSALDSCIDKRLISHANFACDCLIETYLGLEDYKNAFKYLKLQNELRDKKDSNSYKSEFELLENAKLQLYGETYEKQAKSLQSKINLERKRKILVYSIGALAIILIMLFTRYKFIQYKRLRSKQLLNQQQAMNTLYDEFPGLLFKSSNHYSRKLFYINKKAEKLLGIKSIDIAETDLQQFVYEEDKESTLAIIKKMLDDQDNYEVYYRIKTSNGDLRWVVESGFRSMENNKTNIEGWIYVVDHLKNNNDLIALNVNEAKDKERARIASEIHDGLQQTLTLTSIFLKKAAKSNKLDKDELFNLNKSKMHLDNAILESRVITQKLIPKSLEQYGLVRSIQFLIDELNESDELETEFISSVDINYRFDPKVATALYRITQECISNIIKHAKAKSSTVQLLLNKGNLTLIIEDDGIGFDIDRISEQPTNGLISIKKRVESVGGVLQIDSSEKSGTHILVSIDM